MQRRKFLLGLGAIGAGSAVAMGTGAFSSVSIRDRQVTVTVDADNQSTIALLPGDDPDVYLAEDPGELVLDLTGANGEGVNIYSIYRWGDPSAPTEDFAFKIVNNDDRGRAYDVTMTYEYEDASWIEGGASWRPSFQSFIDFAVFDGDRHFWNRPHWAHSQQWPDQGKYGSRDENRPLSLGAGDHETRALDPGETWYFVVTIDTTGAQASASDDLSGTATFDLSVHS